MKKNIDLPKTLTSNNKYDQLNEALEYLSNSEFVENMKNDKIEIINKNFQIEFIDNNLDKLDLAALDNMPTFKSNLEVEIIEALNNEIDKIPETIKDDIFILEESVNNKYQELESNVDYLNDTVKFAKNYNEIVKDQLEYTSYENLPDNVVDNFNNNETLLLISDEIYFDQGIVSYQENDNKYNIDASSNFNQSLNDIDTIIESYRKVIEDGLEIEDYKYGKEQIYDSLYELAAYGILEEDLELESKSEQLMEFVEEKDAYINENVPDLEINLKEFVQELENDLSIELDNDLELSEEIVEKMEKEVEDDFELDF